MSLLLLLHTSSQHLIGRNEHDADDECNGEGTNQAFPHAGVLHLLCWACCEEKRERERDDTSEHQPKHHKSTFIILESVLHIKH